MLTTPARIPKVKEGLKLKTAVLTTFDLDMDALHVLLEDENIPEKYIVFYGGGAFIDGTFHKNLVADCTFPSGIPNYPVTITHGKVWLFEYEDKEGALSYHLIIHSANISGHDAIEIGVELKGTPSEKPPLCNKGISEYFSALTEHMHPDTANYAEKKDRMLELLSRLKNVSFSVAEGFKTDRFRLVSLGTGLPMLNTINNSIFSMCSSYDEFVIAAPIIDHKLLELAKKGAGESGRIIVVTNPSTIEDQLNRGVSGIEFRMPKSGRYVHAKLYLRRLGDRIDLYTGSMNPTVFSVNHNIEMMIHLINPKGIHSLDEFLFEFFGELI